MNGEVVQFQDVKQQFERDRKIFRLKLAGMTFWQIAEAVPCTVEEAKAALTRMCAGVTPEMKQRCLEIDLERIEDLLQTYYIKAKAGDAGATVIVIRLMDRRAKFLGLDTLPRAEATGDNSMREPTSYDRIKEAVLSLKYGQTIDATAEPDGPIP